MTSSQQTIRSAAALEHLDLSSIRQVIGGYSSLFGGAVSDAPDTTTDAYAAEQERVNAGKAKAYLIPRLQALGARTVVDVGCGLGVMVRALLEQGYDAYGVDLPGLHSQWSRLGLPKSNLFIVDPQKLRLPFKDGSVDFVCTFGAIEHVGTTDGHADRRPDHHAVRKQWLREVFRIVRPGGAMLIAGPNRGFPIDVAHGPDSRASALERWLSTKLKVSVHRTWGTHFLWAYSDFERYLGGLDYRLEPQPVSGFLNFSRVPRAAQPLVQAYVDKMPRWLRGSGFNPWVMGLVHKRK